jgi:hypothetical protein
MTALQLMGMRVAVDESLPLDVPDDAENARRIVRHGLAKRVTLCGDPLVAPGLDVDEAVHAYIAPEPIPSRGGRYTGVLHVSPDLYRALRRGWEPRWPPAGHVGEPYLVPNEHGSFLIDRLHRVGVRRWDLTGRTAQIPFTPKELTP